MRRCRTGEVTRRPRTAHGVATAALEHYAYCSGIVDQGVGGLEELVATRLLAGTWCFWWV